MSNNKQQTAVEWFAQESWKLRVELEGGKISLGEYANKYYQLKEQAKEMEKEQILKAYDAGDADRVYQPQQYYNETYGGNNE
jgi:hypothetical protein